MGCYMLNFFIPSLICTLVPFPQAFADSKPAHLDRVQRGFVPAILPPALRTMEPHPVPGPYTLLQLLRPFQTSAGPHRAGQSLLLPSALQQLGAQVTVKERRSERNLWTLREGGRRRAEVRRMRSSWWQRRDCESIRVLIRFYF